MLLEMQEVHGRSSRNSCILMNTTPSQTLRLTRTYVIGFASSFPTSLQRLLAKFWSLSHPENSRLLYTSPMLHLSTFLIPTSILNSCADVLGPLIAKLANLSLSEEVFLKFLSQSHMPLLRKPGADMSDMANYRPITNLNPLNAGRRYTDFAQTSLRRRTTVYRPNGSLPHAPKDGIPAIRCILDPRRRTVYNLCFLMHTGPSISES